MSVARPIKSIVARKVYFRPTKSPRHPKKTAPKGRTINPAAKASRANTRPVVSLKPEKNCFEIVTAREPYRKKSYHSKMVPSDAAKISFRSSVERADRERLAAAGVRWVSRFHSLFLCFGKRFQAHC